MGYTIAKLSVATVLMLGLAIPATALADETHAVAPTSAGSHSAGIITLP